MQQRLRLPILEKRRKKASTGWEKDGEGVCLVSAEESVSMLWPEKREGWEEPVPGHTKAEKAKQHPEVKDEREVVTTPDSLCIEISLSSSEEDEEADMEKKGAISPPSPSQKKKGVVSEVVKLLASACLGRRTRRQVRRGSSTKESSPKRQKEEGAKLFFLPGTNKPGPKSSKSSF